MGLLSWLFGRDGKDARQEPTQAESAVLTKPVQQEQFTVVGNRQMLTDAPYLLPKDLGEINRLDFQHYLLRQTFQGNHLAPLGQPTTILDVGSGTGRWCHEMAQAYPQAHVIGCDLLDQATEPRALSPNYQFVEADVLRGLPFQNQQFDFVHQRLLFLAIPTASWPGEIRELVRVTRPGGWIELVESALAGQHTGPVSREMEPWLVELSRRRGIDATHDPNLEEHLRAAGLVKVAGRNVAVPVGHWGGRVGMMMASNLNALIQAMKPLIISRLGVRPEDFERVVAAQQHEWEEYHTTVTVYAAYGQRPR